MATNVNKPLRSVKLRELVPLQTGSTAERILHLERIIQYSKHEIAIIFNQEGDVIATIKGSHSAIDLLQQTPNLPNNILTHNHPAGTGPSLQDILTLVDYQMQAIRIVMHGQVVILNLPSQPVIARAIELYAETGLKQKANLLAAGKMSVEEYVQYKLLALFWR